MTSEEKVRLVHNDAIAMWVTGTSKPITHEIRLQPKGPVIGRSSGPPTRAWADAWRNIDAQHKANVAKVTTAYPDHVLWKYSGEDGHKIEITPLNGNPSFRLCSAPGDPFHVYALAARMIDEAATANQPA